MPKAKKDRGGTHFMNVDLDIVVSKGLDDLIKALEPAIEISRDGARVTLELNLMPKSPEDSIRGLIKLIQKLPLNARAIWNHAKVRSFNIGIQACDMPYSTEYALSSEVLKLVASVNADVVFTVSGAAGKR
jgi:hypothetical protein